MSATYTTSEADSSVEVCVELVSGETDIAAQIELRTQAGNAQGRLKHEIITTGCIVFTIFIFYCIANIDYSELAGIPLTITGTSRIRCSMVPILEDTIVELDETFSALINTSDPAINLVRDSASVSIRDNDMVTISWSAASYEVVEDGSAVTVCAQITEGEIDRQVIVSYSTRDGTAESN